MSIPGSGLLAALRRKTQAPAEASTPDETKFAARSSAVHALEQAVATGAEASSKKAARGCPVNAANGTFVYKLDETHAGEEQPELTVSNSCNFFYFTVAAVTVVSSFSLFSGI